MIDKTYDWNIAIENMFDLRMAKKIKQKELSKHLGWANCTISSYESGTSLPRIDYVIAFCQFFGISIDDLFSKNLLKELGL